METAAETEKLHIRLRKVIGQLQAIDRMVDDGTPCEDVLSLVHAAKSALVQVGAMILRDRARQCMARGVATGDGAKALEDIAIAVERFARID